MSKSARWVPRATDPNTRKPTMDGFALASATSRARSLGMLHVSLPASARSGEAARHGRAAHEGPRGAQVKGRASCVGDSGSRLNERHLCRSRTLARWTNERVSAWRYRLDAPRRPAAKARRPRRTRLLASRPGPRGGAQDDRLRGVPRDRRLLGRTPALPHLRSRRLLRSVAQSTRPGAFRRDGSPDHPGRPAGLHVDLVLGGRDQGLTRPTAGPALSFRRHRVR